MSGGYPSAGLRSPLLDGAGIAARLPHAGRMCLLDRLEHWDAQAIHCSASSHRDEDHPLRTAHGLLAPCAIEYAAQAMALHGALCAGADAPPAHGLLASVRGVRFAQARLDAVPGRLQVHAQRLAADTRQLQYDFAVTDEAGTVFAQGKATIVLAAPDAPGS
jgi:predicted hotdog family 3-hydroxylacyl-ACP dehydratase